LNRLNGNILDLNTEFLILTFWYLKLIHSFCVLEDINYTLMKPNELFVYIAAIGKKN